MRRTNILIYLGLLAILLIAAIAGGLFDESQRQLFDLWIIVGVIIATLLIGIVRSRQANVRLQQRDAKPSVLSEAEPGPSVSDVPRIGLILVTTTLMLCITWMSLIYLGGMANADAESTALINMQLATSIITTGAALLIARYAANIEAAKLTHLRLGAVFMLVFEAVGLIVLPLIAMKVWRGYIDFPAYSRALNLNWFLLTGAAVAFCLYRSRR